MLILAGYDGVTPGDGVAPSAIGEARVLMVALAALDAALVFLLARRLSLGRPWAVVATLLFALSPLSVFYLRMALLDTCCSGPSCLRRVRLNG